MALFYGTSISLVAQQELTKANRRLKRGNALLSWLSGGKKCARGGRSTAAETDRNSVNPDYLWHFQFPPH